MRAPDAQAPKRKKKRLWWKRGLELIESRKKKNLPHHRFRVDQFFFCDGDRLPPGFGRRDGFFLVFANGEPPASFFNLPGVVAEQSRRTGDSPPPPHSQELLGPGIIAAEAAFINCTPSPVDTGWMLVAIASIDTSATTISSSSSFCFGRERYSIPPRTPCSYPRSVGQPLPGGTSSHRSG